jgi:hypothetical protein
MPWCEYDVGIRRENVSVEGQRSDDIFGGIKDVTGGLRENKELRLGSAMPGNSGLRYRKSRSSNKGMSVSPVMTTEVTESSKLPSS